jgi:dipeptidase E
MGGGDTSKLLRDIDSADFGPYLRQATKQNIPIYGGSAGAIVLGKSIETAPEAKDRQDHLTEGLDMLHGYSVVCHHNSTDYADATRLSHDLDQPLIVLSEQSGALLEDDYITSIGTRSVVLITKTGEITKIEPKEKRSLTHR